MDKNNNNNNNKNTETVEHVDKWRKTDESSDELINEALTKILRQNTKILSKLDIIISNQKALENRVSKVEESVDKNNDNNQGDEEYIKLLAKHRSAWDSLASKVKDIMYVIFKEFNLPTIPAVNTALKESEIRKWKGSPAVKNCYGNLFKKIKNPDLETYMSRILQILKGKNQLSNMQIAYAMSICEIILNLKNLHIQVTESVIKPVLTKNLKKITSKDNYSYSDNDEIKASQEAEETNKGVDEGAEVDEAEEVVDEAEEVLQEEEENEIREQDEEEGGRIYISSTDEETKERMRRLKKQYKK
ncbi:unnamed protein product [Rhizophagus irregularis]|nr:unnamed protein product [Rhizophagus irregularis]